MAKPLRLPGVEEQRVLDELEIDLLVAPTQQARWNRLVKERHYLRRARLVGEQCRYAVSYQGQWVALLGWSAAAWHLGPRDEWLGWSEEQRRRRLHFCSVPRFSREVGGKLFRGPRPAFCEMGRGVLRALLWERETGRNVNLRGFVKCLG